VGRRTDHQPGTPPPALLDSQSATSCVSRARMPGGHPRDGSCLSLPLLFNVASQWPRLEGPNAHASTFGSNARNHGRGMFIEYRGRTGWRRVWRNPRLRRPTEHRWFFRVRRKTWHGRKWLRWLFRVRRKTWHGRKWLGWLFRVRRKTWHGRKRLGRPAVDRWRSRFGRIAWNRRNVEGSIGRHERRILGWKCRQRRRRGWR
jgi:hypothetical protein